MRTAPRHARISALLTILLTVFAAPHHAQPNDDAPPERGSAPNPGLLLGMRAEQVRRQLPVAPVVVIVSSTAELLDALAQWSLERRFPILMDDGSDLAREDINRFVRAFEPEAIYLWSEQAEHRAANQDGFDLVNAALTSAWGAQGNETIEDAWARLNFVPPGLILTHPDEPAFAAAAVLSVARGQPLVRFESPEAGADAALVDAIHEAFAAGADELGLEWQSLGDALDAITVAVSIPHRMRQSPKADVLATTDVIGRNTQMNRFAWASNIVADSAAEAANDAMASVFLQPTHAFFYNGYDQPAESPYSAASFSKELESASLTVAANEGPVRTWRAITRAPIQGGLVNINTSGQSFDFELRGNAYNAATADDIPALATPAVVHFIHSYSASKLDDRRSIARRWLDNGAFCYAGSVEEPRLSAFVPPPLLARRLLAGMPFAAAVRIDNAAPWRVTTIGDPLYTMTLEPAPAADAFAPGNTTPLADRLRSSLDTHDFERSIRILVMQARDADAVALARAANAERKLTPAAAAQAFHAAWREGERELLIDLFAQMPQDAREDPQHRGILWHAARPLLRDEMTIERIGTLYANPPAAGLASAVQLIGSHLEALGTDARAYANSLIDRAPDGRAKRRLERIARQSR